MAKIELVTGVAQVLRRLETKTVAMARGCEQGLTKAGLLLQRESQLRVPVEYGPLKASAFTRKTGRGFGTSVTVGYTAAYALFVHENVEMKGKGLPRSSGKGDYWDPKGRGQAKFLEEPARTHSAKMRQIILDHIKIV